MRTPLAIIHEMAQKGIIEEPTFNIEQTGNEDSKQFQCTIDVQGFTPVTEVSTAKNKAKRRAAHTMLAQINTTIDIQKTTANPPIPFASQQTGTTDTALANPLNNPISKLQEFAQVGLVGNVDYTLRDIPGKPQHQYECTATLGDIQTTFISTSKKKAKTHAAQLLYEQLIVSATFTDKQKQKERQALTPTNSTMDNGESGKTAAQILAELKQQGLLEQLSFEFSTVVENNVPVFQCTCTANTNLMSASAANKKQAKQLVSEKMIAHLQSIGINCVREVKKKTTFLVEPNACGEWIASVCPDDVDLKQLSWYLPNDCVMLTLGVKKPNTALSVDTFKDNIIAETGLMVLINRERHAKKAIEQLQTLANSDGYITHPKQIDKIALGHYFNHRTFAEPNIDWQGRTDHTNDHCFTVDSHSSFDLDDAFCVTQRDDGLDVFIHIADVASLVAENSDEDINALKQGFTYYGASKQLPMLNAKTLYQASLLPQKDRMTWTVKIALDSAANLQQYTLYPSVIRSKFRTDQKSVATFIHKASNEKNSIFRAMTQMSEHLKENRIKEGGLSDVAGENVGYQLVQEFMLLANRCVADFCHQHKIPIPYRTHQFTDTSVDIKALYNSTDNHRALLPFMGRATYSITPKQHEALAFERYCHFTSPIRRYADLLVQRQLHRFHNGHPLTSEIALQEKVTIVEKCDQDLDINQTTIRYLERLQVQFRQSGKKVETVVEKIYDDHYHLKALSQKHEKRLRLAKADVNQVLQVGMSLNVTQVPSYHVINETFDCYLTP